MTQILVTMDPSSFRTDLWLAQPSECAKAAVAPAPPSFTVTGWPLWSTSKLISMPRLKRSVARRGLLPPGLLRPPPLLLLLLLWLADGLDPSSSTTSASPSPPPATVDCDRLTTLLIIGSRSSLGSSSTSFTVSVKQKGKPLLPIRKQLNSSLP